MDNILNPSSFILFKHFHNTLYLMQHIVHVSDSRFVDVDALLRFVAAPVFFHVVAVKELFAPAVVDFEVVVFDFVPLIGTQAEALVDAIAVGWERVGIKELYLVHDRQQ